MRKVFSTDDVHARDRFAYWHDAACRTVVGHDSNSNRRLSFSAEIQSGALADLGLIRLKNSDTDVARTRRHIAEANGDDLFICRQNSGALVLEQNGRRLSLKRGDVTLLDPTLPYVGNFSSNSDLLVIKVPRQALEARMGTSRQTVILSIDPSQPMGNLTSWYLARLPGCVGRVGPAMEATIKEHALDLFAATLAGVSGAGSKISLSRSLALMNIRAAVEAQLCDPITDATAIAAAAGVSVRYANALLAREGTSIVRLLWMRRLERCRTALEDPSQAHRTTSEIAYSWGFSDMTHFACRFKAAYGMVPSVCRRLAMARIQGAG